MTNALVRQEIPDEQVGLIKRMIAKDATNDELQLFLHQCQRTGLDPFSKQIYAISRFSKTDNRKVMAIQVSIDGARLIAERTGKYDNQEGPYWCGEDGEWKDVWLSKAPPRAAKVLVYKVGSSRATTGIAHWDEYHDSKSSFWTTKPALMLAKCAEMLALRKAFPQELSGLYAQEEMGSADEVIDVTPQARPEARDGGSVTDSTPVAPKTSQRPATQGTDDSGNPFEDEAQGEAKSVETLSEAQHKRLHALGVKLYGSSEWEEQRPKLVQAVSKGAVSSSKELTPQEADTLIKGIEKRIKEADALRAQQAQPVAA